MSCTEGSNLAGFEWCRTGSHDAANVASDGLIGMLAGGLAHGIIYFDFGVRGDVDNGFFDDTAAVSDVACSVLLGRRTVDTGTKTMFRVRE